MSYSIDTLLLHNQYKHDSQTGAVNVPIYNTSTFHQFDVDTFGKYDYSRSGNPTREALEDIIALLEGGTKGFAFCIRHCADFHCISFFHWAITYSFQKMCTEALTE